MDSALSKTRSRTDFADRLSRLLPLVLILVGVVAYSTSFSGTFIFDDLRTTEKILKIRNWLAGTAPRPVSWRPVTDSSFVLNSYLPGATQSAVYHAVNLLLHLANALLLFGLVRRVIDRLRPTVSPSSVRLFAALCAGLWVCHPLTTAAVTYITQRYELLMSTFYLLTLYCVARGCAPAARTWAWHALAVVACALGMGSKEVMITAPAAALLLDWALLADGKWRTIRQRWWLHAGLAATWGVLALLMWVKTQQPTTSEYAWEGVSPLRYALVQVGVLVRYLRLAILPTGLCFDYGWGMGVTWARVLPSAVVLAGLGCLAVWGVLRRRPAAVAVAIAFVVLSPTSTVAARPDPIMEHRMYLPLAFLLVGLVSAAYHCGTWGANLRTMVGRISAAGALLVVIAALCVGTLSRNSVYESEKTVWQDTLQKCPRNLRARLGLGAALFSEGRHESARQYFHEIVDAYAGGQGTNTAYAATAAAMAYNNLGVMAFRAGDLQSAHGFFESALELASDFEGARRNLERVRERMRRQ